ncbi:MAG TPA: hypothetical protein VL132_19875 [Planctomycetaceae bacterium]|nr:hypothetical protein [Planctomycetaceae bacterium]
MDSAGQFLEPWHAESAPEFAAELQRELVPGHVLFGAPVMAVARRQDCDDVLFAIRDGTERMAEVHLTWHRETDPRWPRTVLFPSMEAWMESMRSDHDEFKRA